MKADQKPDNWQRYQRDYQTPEEIARYMASMIPAGSKTILEPTPGEGNLLKCLSGYDVTAPEDFFRLPYDRYDCIVMNPPFSSKFANVEYAPAEITEEKGMRLGYWILRECMRRSDNVIALMPWFTISDSDVRLRYLKNFGLKSITALPRKTFQYARIQTCVFEIQKDWNRETEFKVYDLL